ncbi:MAG: biotin/lipoyl-containing protein, partial [Pseudomonadota bacterium]
FPVEARADSGVRAGDAISPFYDPMIAKVITFGPTRDVALSRLSQALADTEVAGTVTNLAFLGALAGHEGFVRGDVDTGLIGRDLDALTATLQTQPRHAVAAAMALTGLNAGNDMTGFSLWNPLRRAVPLACGDHVLDMQFEILGPDVQAWQVDGTTVLARRRQGKWLIDGLPAPNTSIAGDVITVFDQYGITFRAIDLLDVTAGATGDGNLIEAPMPGLVKSVFTAPGAKVAKGDRLAMLEAMKMEHVLLALRDGRVAEVLVREGDQVSAGAALVRLEDAET